ncbi:hypothetical protein KM043_005738 [Ampulex compressa]|nr:hypothetical protein KM043_005738 [Ampulex compressa]
MRYTRPICGDDSSRNRPRNVEILAARGRRGNAAVARPTEFRIMAARCAADSRVFGRGNVRVTSPVVFENGPCRGAGEKKSMPRGKLEVSSTRVGCESGVQLDDVTK